MSISEFNKLFKSLTVLKKVFESWGLFYNVWCSWYG